MLQSPFSWRLAHRGDQLKLGLPSRRKYSSPSLTLAAVFSFSFLSSFWIRPAFADLSSNGVADDTKAKSPPSVSRWSLPFSGSLKKLSPPAHAAPISANPTAAAADSASPVMPGGLPLHGEIGIGASVAPTKSVLVQPKSKAASISSPTAQPQFPVSNSYTVLKITPSNGEVPPPFVVQPQATPQDKAASPKPSKKIITGAVETWQGPLTVDKMVNHLVDSSYDQSPEGQKLDKQVRHFAGVPAKVMATTKDAFQHSFEYQGFEPSERAGKLILDDKYKIRNIAWAEYERQKFVDKIHAQVVASMIQVAEGIGMKDTARGAAVISSAKLSLEALVGEEEAQRTIVALTTWLNHINVADSTFEQAPWNTIERNKKLEEVIRESLKQDPVVKEVTAKLTKYASPGKVKSGAAHIVDTGLNGIALLGPGFAIPIGAEVVETGWKVSTGGSEENKLERELLLDKRIQSRYKVLSQEASLAIDDYRFAQVTHNAKLLSFSEEVLGNLTGKENLPQIVTSHDFVDTQIVPEISESKPSTATGAAGLKQKGQTVLKQLAPLTSL